MKPSRRYLESKLSALKKRRALLELPLARVDTQIHEIEDVLSALTREVAAKRSISVPWQVFARTALKSDSAWDVVDINSVYDDYRDCMYGECWYGRNMDRLGELALYKLTTLSGEEFVICDVCQHTLGGKSLDELEITYKPDTVEIDPDQYEDGVLKEMRKGMEEEKEDD